MNTIVTTDNMLEVVSDLMSKRYLVFDTETTGLKPYNGAKLFSLALGDLKGNAWYFNFNRWKGMPENLVYTQKSLRNLAALFRYSDHKVWIAHNAKFDLHFCEQVKLYEGITMRPRGQIHDTLVLARLFENNHHFKSHHSGYSLDMCARRWLNIEKDDRVKKWILDNGAYSSYPNPQGTIKRDLHYDLVPFEMISEYACQDVLVTAELYVFLRDHLYPTELVDIESKTTSALFEMEARGVLLDRGYCQSSKDAEDRRRNELLIELNEAVPGFVDSSKFLAPYFENHGITLPQTEKGNPQVSDEVLSQITDPGNVALNVLMLRDATKRSNTYWSNYLYLPDNDGVIHPDFFQAGTVTGRLSCRDPNLQNIPKEDKSANKIRKAFVPRPGYFFLSVDYKQMEFRLMLDYAGQEDLIEKIKQGHDPHDATAELTGLSRKAAKTLNFGLLYGMGVAKLAKAIGVNEAEAKKFKYRYFDALPKVQRFIRDASDRMLARGYTFNWAGRRYQLDGPEWAYKAANAIIQGGCADVCKVAMCNLDELLRTKKSKMVLQIHDEILFEIHHEERDVIPLIINRMQTAYKAKSLPLECSMSYSAKSFGEMVEIKNKMEIVL